MEWLIALAVIGLLIFLVLLIPLGVSATYDDRGPLVRVIAGPVRFQIYPKKKKEDQAAKVKKTGKTLVSAGEKKEAQKKKGGRFKEFMPYVQMGLDLLNDLRRKIRVRRLELKLILAGDDPCDLAMAYGGAWAAVGNLIPLLESCFVIKKRDIDVGCDFTAEETLVTARLDMTISFGRILNLAAVYGYRALREYLKSMNMKKGGADK